MNLEWRWEGVAKVHKRGNISRKKANKGEKNRKCS